MEGIFDVAAQMALAKDAAPKPHTRTERLQSLHNLIRAFDPTPAEAETILVVLQDTLQRAGLAGAMLFDVDPCFDELRAQMDELQRSLDNRDHPVDEMDLSRWDRQDRDDEAAEIRGR